MANQRSVSIYSYQEKFFLGELNLEQLIAEVSKAGARGVEMIAEQNCPYEYANPSEEFVDSWNGWMDKYNVVPACLDIFNEQKMYYNRELTKREQLEQIESNFRFAKKLGFPTIRAMIGTPVRYMPEIFALTEKYGIRFGIEVHAPYRFSTPYVQQILEFADKHNTNMIGLVPDMSIFTVRVPRTQMKKLIRSGAHEDIIEKICACYEQGLSQTDCDRMVSTTPGANELDRSAILYAYMGVYENPDDLVKNLDKIVHIHGKVYEMTEDCVEPNLDYETILPLLKDNGYTGFISSEYEGQRHYHDIDSEPAPYDEIEAVRRHQVMMKRILGE